MDTTLHTAHPEPPRIVPIDFAIAQHGAWPVLFAALGHLLGGRDRRLLPADPHLRRDIGLPPLPRGPTHWPLT